MQPRRPQDQGPRSARQPISRGVRIVTLAYTAVTCGMLLGAGLLAGATVVRFEAARAFADRLAADGSAEMLTRGVYRQVVIVSRLLAVALGAAGGLLLAARWWLPARIAADAAVFFGRRPRLSQPTLALLLLITAAGAALRATFLNQPMGWDESYTYLAFVAKPLPVAISAYTDPNNHTFHSVLVKFAVTLFGNEPWAIRLPAFLAGVLSVPATWIAGRALWNDRIGLVAAALIACSSYHIEYSTNARGYTLQTFFALACLWLAADLRGRRNVAGWTAFAVLAALGLWTLPTMVYPLCGIFTWLLLEKWATRGPQSNGGRGEAVRNAVWLLGVGIAVVLLAVLLYAPAIATVGLKSIVANPYVLPLSLPEFWTGLPAMLAETWEHWNRDIPAPIRWLVAATAFFSLGLMRRRNPVTWAIPIFVATSLAVIAAQRVLPYPRVWLWLLPLYFLQASAGLWWLAARVRGATTVWPNTVVVLALLSAPMAFQVARQYPILRSPETGVLPDAEAIAGYLAGILRPDERIVAPVPSSTPLQYYFEREMESARPLISNEAGDLPQDRVIVVVNHLDRQTLRKVLREHGLAGEVDDGSARLLREYPSASVYEVLRQP